MQLSSCFPHFINALAYGDEWYPVENRRSRGFRREPIRCFPHSNSAKYFTHYALRNSANYKHPTKQTALNMRNYSCLQQFNASVCACIGLKTHGYVTLRFRGMTNFNKWTCRSYKLCMNKAYVQKCVSYIKLLPNSAAALPAVSTELAFIKSTQRRSATINAVIKCNQRLSILYMAGGCTMLSSERSDWVRWGPVGSDVVRLGPVG